MLAAPTIILYSQGYRLSIPPQNGKILVKTGGLFVKAAPKQADIYINGNLSKKTDIFFGSSLIENLMPKKYDIEIRKEGYHAWKKQLEIKEKQVTEVKYVTLFPQNPSFAVAAEGVNKFWPSPDGTKIILYSEATDGWSIKLFDVENGLKSQLAEESDIAPDGANLVSLEWSQDNKKINILANLHDEQRYYSLNVDRPAPQLIREDTRVSLPDGAVADKISGTILYYLDKSGFLFKKDTVSSQIEKINEKSIPIDEKTTPRIWDINGVIFLSDGQSLYVFVAKDKEFQKIFDGLASDLEISPDVAKIAYFSNSELWVYYLKEKTDEPKKAAGDKLFIVRLSEKIQDCAWINADYLAFSSGGNIKIAEMDDRDKLNVIDLVKFSGNDKSSANQNLFWENNKKNFYILDGTNLYQAEIK
jgi:hypothetical protein